MDGSDDENEGEGDEEDEIEIEIEDEGNTSFAPPSHSIQHILNA